MRITLAGIAHAVVSISMLIYSVAFRNTIAFSVSLALILIFCHEYRSFLEIRRAVENLSIERTLEKRVSNELEDVEVVITVTNKSKTVIPYLILEDRVPKFMSVVGSRPFFRLALMPGDRVAVRYRAKPMAPGAHDFEGVMVHFLDALGYFNDSLSVECRGSITVLPLSTSATVELSSVQRIVGIVARGRALGGLFDLANIREYAEGDDARRIVWKVYARTGKLMVREDFGETMARVLVLIDVREREWSIGEVPNTLAQVQLRLARALMEFLARSRCVVDVAICSGVMPKVVRNAEKDIAKSLYAVASVLPTGGGCESPITIFSESVKHLDRTYEFYDLVMLVTNPISLIAEHSPNDIENLLKVFENRVIIAMPRYRYEDVVQKEVFSNLLERVIAVVEKAGGFVEIVEGFYVL